MMTSTEMVESALVLLKKYGFRPKRIKAEAGSLEIDGIEPLPPTPAEAVQESEKKRSMDELREDDMRTLGI